MKRAFALLAALASAGPAGAQTMLDQEQRLIQIHSLLVDLPPVDAPGSYRPGEVSLGLEVVAIPAIDGTTGSKKQITASDRTPVFPRPRLALGLPAPDGFRAFAGVSYIPPIQIRGVSSHFGALEGGIAWAPGAARVGVRAHVLYAESKSPVTDPQTRDTLQTFELGADLSAGHDFRLGAVDLTPYGGVGVTRLAGDFRVTSDGYLLSSRYTALALHGGLRMLLWRQWEVVAEMAVYPGRLVHPRFRAAYVIDWGGKS
jgi:hypothetical protein